ncbi:hypothetical protein DKX38_015678 [Salix brachista]|uniref:CCHC-type domain-containing protein n=1 Tax=Salix brachista TaxID=2182728 RepID=A0A5N5L5V7_9ROSI|nr:hypothetical protein DKX38_015678 [Salix brachista]
MASDKTESYKTESSSVPVIQVQSENSSFSTNVTLTESNYDVWSQIMEMQIAGREKLEYLISNTIPEKTDPSYGKWYAENQKIKGWLLTSMSPEIMKRYLRLPTAHGIWTALAKAFYDGADESQLFSLNQRAFSTKQVGRPISTYYGDLVEIFQELDHRDKIVMKDPDDVIAYKKSIERLRVHIFLNGLDEEFEQVRGEILRRESALDLEETYAYVRRDSIRRNTLNGEPGHLEPSAMIARRSRYQRPLNLKPDRNSGPPNHNQSIGSQNCSYEVGAARPERMCTHCGETGHTKQRCYELIGYPDWWDSSKAPRKRNSKANPHVSVAVAEPNHMFGNNPHVSVVVAEPNHKIGKDSSSNAITGNAGDTAMNTGDDAENAGNDEVQTATKAADSVEITAHGDRPIDTWDNPSSDNEECPVNENTEEHQDMEEYTNDSSYDNNSPEIVDNQDIMEEEVPTASHNVPINQLSSQIDSRLESHEIHPFESLKELPNRVTRAFKSYIVSDTSWIDIFQYPGKYVSVS